MAYEDYENHDLKTYEPAYIKRSAIEQTGDDVRNAMSVTVSRTNDFVALFIAASPEVPIYFTLYRGHGTTFVTHWVGSVLGVTFEQDDAVIQIGPPYRGGKTSGLRRKYQKQCTYPLYGFQCGLNRSSWVISGTVNAINGKVLTINAAGAYADGWFRGGIFVSGETERMVVSHSGTSINVGQGVNLVDVGDSCSLYAGCTHTYTVCNDKFNNRINYGGHPWIPSRNPFGGDGVT
jgi:uncharacterized phage protein (TIGR02218 family)